jgi:hypothetical protein
VVEARYIGGRTSGGGRYALEEVVGQGGFATVWRARILEEGPAARGLFGRRSRGAAGQDVAVKVIPVYSAGERSRALREGQIASELHHPNIVETIEVIPGDTEVYLITEFVHGLPLDEAARHYTMGEVIDALAQILEALVYAHSEGVIHRDIKPQNALVDSRDGRVKLTDFGVAYRVGDTRLTQVGFAVGTPGYIAPEVLDGDDPTELTDIYAVGATARTLLARLPDEPPPRLREFVDRATSPNPAHRPRSAEAALRLLTGRREGPVPVKGSGTAIALSGTRFGGVLLRSVNGAMAAWLGYLGASLILDSATSLGVAAGFGVLGYLLPRLGALGLIVALAVMLWQSGSFGLGFSTLIPALGLVWVAAGSADPSVRRAPLSPLAAIPLAALPIVAGGLGAGVPILFGAFMRPVGAALSSAVAAVLLVGADIFFGDGVLPYLGVDYLTGGVALGPGHLATRIQDILTAWDPLILFFALWAVMAVVVSLAERVGRPLVGVVGAVVGGGLGYAYLGMLAVSTGAREVTDAGFTTQALISLVLTGIIYGVARYLVGQSRG